MKHIMKSTATSTTNGCLSIPLNRRHKEKNKMALEPSVEWSESKAVRSLTHWKKATPHPPQTKPLGTASILVSQMVGWRIFSPLSCYLSTVKISNSDIKMPQIYLTKRFFRKLSHSRYNSFWKTNSQGWNLIFVAPDEVCLCWYWIVKVYNDTASVDLINVCDITLGFIVNI